MRVRALALRLHFMVGIVTGLALIVLGLSGAVLVFRPELESATSNHPRPSAPSEAPLAPLQALVETARRDHPGFAVTDLWLPDHRAAVARVGMLDQAGGQVEVLVDPRTAETLGSFWLERSPLHALRLLHAELYMGSRGATVVGVLGLWLFLQGATGLYLWWPLARRPRWGFHIRWSRPWPVVGRDLHKALGAASIMFHLPMAATGALLGLSAVLTPMADDGLTAPGAPRNVGASFDVLARSVEALALGGRVTAFHLSPDGGRATVRLHMPGDPDPRGGSAVILAASDARVLAVRDARHASWGAKSFAVARALHVGDLGGSLTRSLYVLGGLASVGIALSGYALAVARPGQPVRARAASP